MLRYIILLFLTATVTAASPDSSALFQQRFQQEPVTTDAEELLASAEMESVVPEGALPEARDARAAPVAKEAKRSQLSFCEQYPDSCKPPERFSCSNTGEESLGKLMNETGNWRWCWSDPLYLKYTTYCQKEQVKAASTFLGNVTLHNEKISDHEAQYCFAAGLCNITGINEDSTFEDNELLCDFLYGRKGWKKTSPTLMGMRPSHKGRRSAWGRVACNLGLFHCDVMYCQDNFCSSGHWRELYGALGQAGPDHSDEVERVAKDAYESNMEERILRTLSHS